MSSEQVKKDINAKSANLIKSLTLEVQKLKNNVPVLNELRKRFEKEQLQNAETTNLLNVVKELEQQKKQIEDEIALEHEKEGRFLCQQSQLKKDLESLEKGNKYEDTTALASDVGKLQNSLRFLQHMTGMKFLPVKDNILEGHVVSANLKDAKHFQFDLSKHSHQFITDSLWSLVESSSDSSWNSVGGPAIQSKKAEINGAKKKK